MEPGRRRPHYRTAGSEAGLGILLLKIKDFTPEAAK